MTANTTGVRIILGLLLSGALPGCGVFEEVLFPPGAKTEIRNSSSLVSFLYPEGVEFPTANSIPQLRIPLRVGLAFLPTQSSGTALGEAQKQELLERIRQRFLSRQFVKDIVIIPDYYLASAHGFSGLEGVQRLYGVDVMALVSYDQVTHTDQNKLSMGYLTIVGAYVLRGNTQDFATLVDLAVVDPATRSLLLRAGGTHAWHDTTTLVDADRNARKGSSDGFDQATHQMIENFDMALTGFESDVRAGTARVKIVERSAATGGSGALGGPELICLLALALRRRSGGL
jgi:rhombotail lipoprotein